MELMSYKIECLLIPNDTVYNQAVRGVKNEVSGPRVLNRKAPWAFFIGGRGHDIHEPFLKVIASMCIIYRRKTIKLRENHTEMLP
ncbi:hypothetical protein CEXT_796871 [Caerostris extrusa]|uniref:Uncharacterized protein n=1 Tax=Caerostris extrusa TaxID=172846 RepID=A0AAV4XCV2_CAEEX|nr:hypothetical protein CEXT_796871 [Caerostris extrusa]